MPLTPAEKSKRYREKIKSNPEQYEAFKKKELQRQKKHQKKVKELTEKEKQERRKRWREQKRKQKEKKKNSQLNPQPRDIPDATFHSIKIKYRKLGNNYRKALHTISRYKTALESLKKKLYRMKKKHEKEIELVKGENDKLNARQETLEISLRSVYRDCKKTKEKELLKNVIRKHAQSLRQAPESKILGLKGRIRKRNRKLLINKKFQEEIESFYLRDDISRSTAGKKETRTKGKKKIQTRYLVDTLKNVYEIYKKDGGACGFTTFYRYKPFYILSPSVNNRDTCLCIKHSNFEYLFNALKFKGVIVQKSIKELLNIVACDTRHYDCMYNKCKVCFNPNVTYDKEKLECDITWYKWARVSHQYEKSGKVFTTKKTTKQQIKGTVRDIITEFKRDLPTFKTHTYNWVKQQREYRECVKNMNDDEIAILCDFSENFECKYGEEVQSMHFGASKNSITLHTGVIFWKDLSQSFVTVSDNNCHEPNAIWAHLIPVIKLAKTMNSLTKVIHFFSDGPCSQYRQKKNFYLLTLFTSKLKLLYSTWSFSESGHGKSIADGIGGSVKRQLDKRISYGHDVTNATEALQILQNNMKMVKSFYISDQDIQNMNKLIPDGIQAVPGTMQLHQIICTQYNQIKYRQLSCFCGKFRGLCSCHSPKTHVFVTNKILQELSTDVSMTLEETTALDNLQATIPGTSENNINVSRSNSSLNLITNETKTVIDSDFRTSNVLDELDNSPLKLVNIPDYLTQDCKTPQSDTEENINSDFLLSEINDTPELLSSIEQVVDNFMDISGPLVEMTSLTNNQESFKSKCDLVFPFPEFSSMAASKGNVQNTPTKENTTYQPPKKKMKTLPKDKNTIGKQLKSSRTFPCHVCMKRQPFNIKLMVKCMVCKNWVCFACSGTTFFDYICGICLETDSF